MKRLALVTGATSGIGKSTAELLGENDFNLIITGRRKDRLLELKKDIESKSKVEVFTGNFDIRNKEEVFEFIDNLPEKFQKIDVLVNNAGLAAGLNTIQEGQIEDWEQMIDTNIKGLLYISKKVSNLMISNKSGHIVNIGSIAGKEVYPNGNVYCASKHAVDALNKAMRIDLLPHNIKVTSINPGMVETEFSIVRLKDKIKADAVYQGFTPLYARDIAETVLFVLTRAAHVNINEMLVMPTAQASATNVFKKV